MIKKKKVSTSDVVSWFEAEGIHTVDRRSVSRTAEILRKEIVPKLRKGKE